MMSLNEDKPELEEFEKEWQRIQSESIKNSQLRLEYEAKVHALKDVQKQYEQQGMPEAEMAQRLHSQRRELGRVYKEAAPPLLREYIYAATAKKYSDPLGPDYAALRQRKTDKEIIDSASRPIKNLDDRLTVEGFREWFLNSRREKGEE